MNHVDQLRMLLRGILIETAADLDPQGSPECLRGMVELIANATATTEEIANDMLGNDALRATIESSILPPDLTNNITSVIYTLCDACAHAVTRADFSGVLTPNLDDVLGCIRVAGRLSYAGPTAREGFRQCEFCGTATNGTHHTFVGQTFP